MFPNSIYLGPKVPRDYIKANVYTIWAHGPNTLSPRPLILFYPKPSNVFWVSDREILQLGCWAAMRFKGVVGIYGGMYALRRFALVGTLLLLYACQCPWCVTGVTTSWVKCIWSFNIYVYIYIQVYVISFNPEDIKLSSQFEANQFCQRPGGRSWWVLQVLEEFGGLGIEALRV